jgi:hypothetical protein
MTKLPTATKAWRFQVAEAFNDQKFFRMREDEAVMWKPLICALMDGDKERFGELLGKLFNHINRDTRLHVIKDALQRRRRPTSLPTASKR